LGSTQQAVSNHQRSALHRLDQQQFPTIKFPKLLITIDQLAGVLRPVA